jgi:hypothetical protein
MAIADNMYETGTVDKSVARVGVVLPRWFWGTAGTVGGGLLDTTEHTTQHTRPPRASPGCATEPPSTAIQPTLPCNQPSRCTLSPRPRHSQAATQSMALLRTAFRALAGNRTRVVKVPRSPPHPDAHSGTGRSGGTTVWRQPATGLTACMSFTTASHDMPGPAESAPTSVDSRGPAD